HPAHPRPDRPGRVGPLSMVLNLVTLGVILSVRWEMLMGIPVRGYLGMLALVLIGVGAGWLLGGPGSENRTAMTMATSVRNVGVSLVNATGSFAGTKAVTTATAFAVFQTIVMALVALGWGRLLAAPTGTTKIEGPVTEDELPAKDDNLPAKDSMAEGRKA